MNITQTLLARCVVLVFAVVTGTLSFAQGPRGAGGPPEPGGPPGAPLAMLLLDGQVASALGMTTVQQADWTALQAAAQAARTQGDAARTAMQTLVTAQFGSGAPDLVAIEKAMAAEHQTMEIAMASVSAQAMAFYTSLNTGQQAIVTTAAQARFSQAPRR